MVNFNRFQDKDLAIRVLLALNATSLDLQILTHVLKGLIVV